MNEMMDQFLLNRLSSNEKEDFQHQMDANPDWPAELEERRDLLKGIEAFGQGELKKELQAIQEEVIGNRTAHSAKSRSLPIRRLLAAAAAIAVLVFAINWIVQPKQAAPEQLAADFFEPYDIPIGIRGNDGTDQRPLFFLKSYKSGDYQAAMGLLTELLDENPDSNIWLLAAGNCQFELGQTNAALGYFNKVIENDPPFYLQQAIWYKSLALLKNGQTPEAIQQLQQLGSNPQADKHYEAVELLKALNAR